MISAVIFDVDGVLVDSVPAAQKVRTKLLAEHGVDFAKLPDPDNEQHKGSSLKSLLKAVKHHHPDVTIDFNDMAQRQMSGILHELRENHGPAEPGLRKLLEDLRAHGVSIAIASSGIQPAVKGKLALLGITEFFDVIVTAEDVEEHKPDPAAYILALDKLGADPKKAFIFEDSTPGVTAGNRAGCRVVGFTKYSDTSHSLDGTLINIDDWSVTSFDWLDNLSR